MEKTALIVGGGKHRIGNVVAGALAERGYDIALHYHHSAAEAAESVAQWRKSGILAETFRANVADEGEVARLFEEVKKTFGRLDILVTAAAIWEKKTLEETTATDVRRHFEINALGTFLCCQQAGRIMVEQPEGGSIVTIGDWAVARPYPHYAAYFASKGAVPAITRSFAVELARRNKAIRVNCILPGPVMQPETLSDHEVKGMIANTLLKRLGRPENIAQAVLFLIDNDYVTGVCLPVDGGRTIAGGC
jgi:pteridine reductase